MIQDKDYTLRLIRQLSQALEKLILGKPEESLMQRELDYDSLMKDIFKTDFPSLAAKSPDEVVALVSERPEREHADYFEMLGNLFYLKNRENPTDGSREKAKVFYELYLRKSGIFSLPVINRINELKA